MRPSLVVISTEHTKTDLFIICVVTYAMTFPSVLLVLEVHLGATLLFHYEATVVSVNKPVTVTDVSVKRWVPPCWGICDWGSSESISQYTHYKSFESLVLARLAN